MEKYHYMKYNKHSSFLFFLFTTISFYFNSCGQGYDSSLMRPDGNGKGYILTPLGCLVNGAWQITNQDGYNRKLFINEVEVSSVGVDYGDLQKNLVFELHKDGSITYWLLNENGGPDTSEIRRVAIKPEGYSDLKKVYTKGYWKADFEKKTIVIRFDELKMTEFNFTYGNLSSDFVEFQQTSFIDTVYNNKKVKMKEVKSMYYRKTFIRF